MSRTLIKDVKSKIGEKVSIMGRVMNARLLSNVSFLQVQDYTGTIQTVWENVSIDLSSEASAKGEALAKAGDAVEITGSVRADERAKGGCEILGEELKIISTSIEDLPIDLAKKDLNL